MSTNFPSSKDTTTTLPTESASTTLSVNHVTAHTNLADAVIALETKVGVDSSAVTTSHDYKLSGVTGSDKAVSKTGTETLTNKTLTAPTITSPDITVGSDATGDMYYRNSGGHIARLPKGNDGDVIQYSGGLPVTGAASTATYSTYGQVLLKANAEYYAADSGGTDAYAITLSPAPSAYATGQTFYFKANTVNTGAATLNVNSLGAKTIVKGVNTTLNDGDIAAGQFVTVIYDGTNFVLQNPTAVSIPSPTVFQQVISAVTANGTIGESYFTTSYLGFSTTNPMFVATSGSSGLSYITRYIKLYNGSIVATHQVQSGAGTAGDVCRLTTIGNYVYLIHNVGGSAKLYRYDAADLANETLMTISGTAVTSASLFTDGTNLYQMQSAGSAQIYTISGTTSTSGSTVSYTSSTTDAGYWSDGTTLYGVDSNVIYTWAIGGGSRTTGYQMLNAQYFVFNGATSAAQTYGGCFKEVGNTLQILTMKMNKTVSNSAGGLIGKVIPVTIF